MDFSKKKKISSISLETSVNPDDFEVDLLDDTETNAKSSSVNVKIIDNEIKFVALKNKYAKSSFLKYIRKNVCSENIFNEIEIPNINTDEEAKLYLKSVKTTNTKIVKENTRFLKSIGYINQNISDNLDILDYKSEPKMLSVIGRFICLLAATCTSYNSLTIMVLSIIYGKDFMVACFIAGTVSCIPMMYFEILIGQITPLNISSFYSRIAPAWRMLKIIFMILFFLCGVYSIICGVYYLTEFLNFVLDMKRPDIDTKIYDSGDNSNYIGQKLAYFCLYAPKEMVQFDECKSFHESFHNGYYSKNVNAFQNIRFFEKSIYMFSIIPSEKFSVRGYICCFCIWFMITSFKKFDYAFITGIVAFFYASYVISLFFLVYYITSNSYYYGSLNVFLQMPTLLKNIELKIWILAFLQMVFFFKSGHGIVMKIASKFPKETNSTNMVFVIYLVNFSVLIVNICLNFLLYGFASNQDGSTDFVSTLSASRMDIRTYISSSLYQYFDSTKGMPRVMIILYNFGLFGLSTYQAFIYIDLFDCELHNVALRHVRYATKRFKTTGAVTFLFLLIPMFSTLYPEVGKMFFLVEEAFNNSIIILICELIIIAYVIGIKKFTVSSKSKLISHLINFAMRLMLKFIILPFLIFFLYIRTIMGSFDDPQFKNFAGEMFTSDVNIFINNSFDILTLMCAFFLPLVELFKAVFLGKSPTITFTCDLSSIN
uniref:Sodium-dependent neutral amino acid transporter SLC6A17 n=1 Tax=Parastrongyloides trichosuri TaxID=131310 RepID=A0A0N4ZV63_PARTI